MSYKLICTFTQAAQALDARSYYYYFFNLYENVQHVKRDIFTADIYYYLTTNLTMRNVTLALQHMEVLCNNGLNLKRFVWERSTLNR